MTLLLSNTFEPAGGHAIGDGVRRAHLVAIRQEGEIIAWQLRVGKGGPGQTRLYSANKLGSPNKAKAAARADCKAMGLVLGLRPGGVPKGTRNRLSPTSSAGIRWEWNEFPNSWVLYVVCSFTQRDGRAGCSRFSTQKHGLEGALDLAIQRRVSHGAPMPDKAKLMTELRRCYRAGTPDEQA
jgi:hypothetical protein